MRQNFNKFAAMIKGFGENNLIFPNGVTVEKIPEWYFRNIRGAKPLWKLRALVRNLPVAHKTSVKTQKQIGQETEVLLRSYNAKKIHALDFKVIYV